MADTKFSWEVGRVKLEARLADRQDRWGGTKLSPALFSHFRFIH